MQVEFCFPEIAGCISLKSTCVVTAWNHLAELTSATSPRHLNQLTTVSCSCYAQKRPSSDCGCYVDGDRAGGRGSRRVCCQSTGLWSTPHRPSPGRCRSLRPHWFCRCSDFLTGRPALGLLSAGAAAAYIAAVGWQPAVGDSSSSCHNLLFCVHRDPCRHLTGDLVASHGCCI